MTARVAEEEETGTPVAAEAVRLELASVTAVRRTVMSLIGEGTIGRIDSAAAAVAALVEATRHGARVMLRHNLATGGTAMMVVAATHDPTTGVEAAVVAMSAIGIEEGTGGETPVRPHLQTATTGGATTVTAAAGVTRGPATVETDSSTR